MVEKLRERPADAMDVTDPLTSSPFPELEHWIITHCRKEWDEPTGYVKQLYEVWTAGKLIAYVRNKFRLKQLIFSGYREENRDHIRKLPFRTEEEEVIKRLSRIKEPKVNPKLNKFINKTSVIHTDERRKSTDVHLANLQAMRKYYKKLRKRRPSSISQPSLWKIIK